jgi:hypothetical protein
MKNILVIPALALLLSTGASAQSRDWVKNCQKAPERSGSLGHRECTALYLTRLEQRQVALLKKVSAKLEAPSSEGQRPKEAASQLVLAQRHWLAYAKAHCLAGEHMFGAGNSAGDAFPSCMVGEYEMRNRQLTRILEDNYER